MPIEAERLLRFISSMVGASNEQIVQVYVPILNSRMETFALRHLEAGRDLPKNSLFKGNAGFSLVEVVLALGVFAAGILLIYGLLPGLLTQSQKSWQDTRAAQISRQIVSDLRAGGGLKPALVLSGGFADTQLTVQEIDTGIAGSYQVNYSAEGQPVPAEDPSAALAAEIELIPVPDRTGICEIRIEIRQIGQARGSGFQFHSRIAHSELGRVP